MTTNMTERDKKLLAGLGIFCVAALLAVFIIVPLYGANQAMKQAQEENQARIEEMKNKELQLPTVRTENAKNHENLALDVEDLYPLFRTQDVDKLLTEKVLSHGLSVIRLQISMPSAAANITGYGLQNDPGSNPDAKDGIWIAEASLDTSGADVALDSLIDDLSVQTPGVRVTRINWSRDRRTVDSASGLTEEIGVLNLQVQVLMTRKD